MCENCIMRILLVNYYRKSCEIQGDLSIENGELKAVIDILRDDLKEAKDRIEKLSNVQLGQWIYSNIENEKYVCSECGGACWYYDVKKDVAKSRFCPNCGARMEV